jgi:hypothetical protein
MVEEISDPSTRRLAKLLHFVIYEGQNVQFFHRLRIGTKDLGAFSELLALALKDYNRLRSSGDDEIKQAANFEAPAEEDIRRAQELFSQDKNYVKILLARASAPCFKGRCWKGG